MMSWYILLTGYLMGLNLPGYTTLEIRYYRPFEAVDEGFLTPDQHFKLVCNAARSLFIPLPVQPEEDQMIPDNNSVWIAKDLTIGLSTQNAQSIQGNNYIIEDIIHPMQWRIMEETRKIAGMATQKAQCNFRGRAFTAWFAPAIPLDNGPWKLGGLPGLILEAYDDQREIVFCLKSIKRLGRIKLHVPAFTGRKVELETYLELNRKELKQYLDFIENRLEGLSTDIDLDLNIGKFSSWEYPK